MDREGDSYDLWSALIRNGHRFVIRSRYDRRLAEDGERLSEAVERASVIVEREVALSPRRQEKIIFNRKRHPARAGRMARLALSATSIEIARSATASADAPDTLRLNIVHVREVGTQGEHPPVEWTLATSEPIDTVQDVTRIVDCYRARWVIEEYFKAIKTGCAYEKRQFESLHTLLNALAVFVPIAWRLLLLRTLAREAAEQPAQSALTTTQIQVLTTVSPQLLPKNPTVQQAMLAIAQLGGHIKNNGAPGWLVLGRGFQKLLALEQGWLAALSTRSDQS